MEHARADVARLERLRRNLRCSSPQILPAVRRAAVACLLQCLPDGSLECLFITRAAHPGDPWSGDVAWPGGRLEQGETELQAAMREVRTGGHCVFPCRAPLSLRSRRADAPAQTQEEIGIDLRTEQWQLLGPLPDRPAVRTQSGLPKLVVRAFVFLHVQSGAPLPPFVPAPHEVAAVWWVPLRTLTDCGPLRFFEVPCSRLQTRLPMLVRHPCAYVRPPSVHATARRNRRA